MKIIIGLGNYGDNFHNTRHNLGYEFVEYLVKEFKCKEFENKYNHSITSSFFNDEKIFFLKPQKYINNSGEAVNFFLKKFKLNLSDILIIYDDITIPLGSFRFRKNGSSGGHNGIKSIINFLGSDQFDRIKIGTGHDKKIPLDKWVLGKLDEVEKKEIYLLKNKIKIFILEWLNK